MRFLHADFLLLVTIFLTTTAANVRQKRVLAFRKGSVFFLRINYKIDSVPYNSIFAQASGFKVAWELPHGRSAIHRPVRDIHESAMLMYESHGLDGKSCLMKNICDVTKYVKRNDGVVVKILRLLAAGSVLGNNDDEESNLLSNCPDFIEKCPLRLHGIEKFSN